MGGIIDAVGGILGFGDDPGDQAAQAATQAAGVSADAQREALQYLKEREAIPQQFREGALQQLGGLYGLEGGTGSQQTLIDQAIQSPLYQSILGGREAGEEAILRNASATGGLRSGGVQENLYDYNTQLQNQALLQSYNQQLMGLQGLGNLPSMAPQIAGGMAGIGQTQAQGITAAEQARQTGSQQGIGNIMSLAQLGIGVAGMFSDRKLKTNIKQIGEINGHKWYSFDWNSVANKLGLTGSTYGAMADEVFKEVPDAVTMKDNFMFVNYSMMEVI